MVKIIIVTGFLGSGKTTFLKDLLKNTSKNIAFIINELGKIGLDDKLLKHSIISNCDTLLLDNGCLCCNKIDNLKVSLENLLNNYEKNKKPLDFVIIETTGIANVAPIIYTVLSDIFLSNHFCIHKIITVIDAQNYENHIKNDENINQIASANEIIITKKDLNNDFKKDKLNNINASAFVYFKDEYNEEMFFNKTNKMPLISNLNNHISKTISISFEFKKELDWDRFCIWLSMLLYKYGENILRIKGILDVGANHCVSVNGIYHHIYPAEHVKINPKQSNLIIIFQKLEKSKIIKSFTKFLNLNDDEVIIY